MEAHLKARHVRRLGSKSADYSSTQKVSAKLGMEAVLLCDFTH